MLLKKDGEIGESFPKMASCKVHRSMQYHLHLKQSATTAGFRMGNCHKLQWEVRKSGIRPPAKHEFSGMPYLWCFQPRYFLGCVFSTRLPKSMYYETYWDDHLCFLSPNLGETIPEANSSFPFWASALLLCSFRESFLDVCNTCSMHLVQLFENICVFTGVIWSVHYLLIWASSKLMQMHDNFEGVPF